MERDNLMAGPPATYLLENEEAAAALRAGASPSEVAARFPAYSAAWAALAEAAFAAGDPVMAYAYARTGYQRGLPAVAVHAGPGRRRHRRRRRGPALRAVPPRKQRRSRCRAARQRHMSWAARLRRRSAVKGEHAGRWL